MIKRLGYAALGAVVLVNTTGCQTVKDATGAAGDFLKAPPQALIDGAQLALNFLLQALGIFLGGATGGLFK